MAQFVERHKDLEYDAFVSYAWASDKALAPVLVRAVHNFARKWYWRRSVRLFLDVHGLATEEAWVGIRRALDGSRRLVLLASPSSAKSESVTRELAYWRTLDRPPPLIVVTHGQVRWSDADMDFDWQLTTALPRTLSGAFKDEPLRLDARQTRLALSSRNPQLRQVAAVIYSILSGKKLDDVFGEDVRVHRLNILWAGLAALVAITAIAIATHVQYQHKIDENAATIWADLFLDAFNQNEDSLKALSRLGAASDSVKLRFVDKLIKNGGIRKVFARNSLAITRAIIGNSSKARLLLVNRANSASEPNDPLLVLAAHLGSPHLASAPKKLAFLPRDALASIAPLLNPSSLKNILSSILDSLDDSARTAETLEERRAEPEISRLLRSICSKIDSKHARSVMEDLTHRFDWPQAYHNYPELAECYFSIPEVQSKRLLPPSIEAYLQPPKEIEKDDVGASKYPQFVQAATRVLDSKKAAKLLLSLLENAGKVESPEVGFAYATAASALAGRLATVEAANVVLAIVGKERLDLYTNGLAEAVAIGFAGQGNQTPVTVGQFEAGEQGDSHAGRASLGKALALVAAKRQAKASSKGIQKLALTELAHNGRFEMIAAVRNLKSLGDERKYVERLTFLLRQVVRGNLALLAQLDDMVTSEDHGQHIEDVIKVMYFRHPDLAPWLALATASVARYIKPDQASIAFLQALDSYQTYRDRPSHDTTQATPYIKMLSTLVGRTQGTDLRRSILALVDIAKQEYGADLELVGQALEDLPIIENGNSVRELLEALLRAAALESRSDTLNILVRAIIAVSNGLEFSEMLTSFKRVLANPLVPQQAIELMLEQVQKRSTKSSQSVTGWWDLQTR